jgi:hypothetical protein
VLCVRQLEVNFLPVYHPSPEEVADPDLYARNVQGVRASASRGAWAVFF